MRLLIDTYVLIWAVLADKALPERFRAALADLEAMVHVSAASAWEVAIKRALGKLAVLADHFDRALPADCKALPVTWAHAPAVEAVPPHHADLYDRMVIAGKGRGSGPSQCGSPVFGL